MGNIYNRVYIWCSKYSENRYCERCANNKWCASKHTGLLNSCLGKLCLHPYLVVPLISARVTLISTRVSVHCQAILLQTEVTNILYWFRGWYLVKATYTEGRTTLVQRSSCLVFQKVSQDVVKPCVFLLYSYINEMVQGVNKYHKFLQHFSIKIGNNE